MRILVSQNNQANSVQNPKIRLVLMIQIKKTSSLIIIIVIHIPKNLFHFKKTIIPRMEMCWMTFIKEIEHFKAITLHRLILIADLDFLIIIIFEIW